MDICGSLASQRIWPKPGSKKSSNREVTIYEKYTFKIYDSNFDNHHSHFILLWYHSTKSCSKINRGFTYIKQDRYSVVKEQGRIIWFPFLFELEIIS
jgi:hypothetical protein